MSIFFSLVLPSLLTAGNDAIVVGAVVVVVVFACDIISSAESAEVRFGGGDCGVE